MAGGIRRWLPEECEAEEQRRVAMGVRRPIVLVARRARAGRKHVGQWCWGCDGQIDLGDMIVVEEDINCAIDTRRHRHWHADHHPAAVQRALNSLRRQVTGRGHRAP